MPHDAIVIGGSFAGLSAAMYIARARRSVVVIDAGAPRNRFAEHAHGFFAQDGSEPRAMLATAHSQVAAYPTADFIDGEAIGAAREAEGFSVQLVTGEILGSARLVLAFGISDDLPAIPGVAERWGKSVIHCPYCHGFEFSGQRLGVLYTSPMSLHQAMLVAEWGPMRSPTEILEVERPHHVRTRFGNLILKGESDVRFEPTSDGTRLTQVFRTRGFISALTGRLFAAGSYEGSFRAELETFRTIAERESNLTEAGGRSGN